ncbi:acetyltransferase [Domibacillus sp. A3M-37]|uniref:acetyltransferase n=1 Tax=Domibacillus sp. A3M-37 TaxID=2962037 RepID=UPI0020B6DD30|nr:acetyltransferase [Domibacillus sp. A3M-37]MCP3761393.1 acetyltransferase [Domibacillus sp. A3M-37]
MRKIVVIGHGGHSKVVQDTIQSLGGHTLIAVLDDRYTDISYKDGVQFGPVSEAKKLAKDHDVVFTIAIGTNWVREKIAKELYDYGATFETLIHPFSFVSPSAHIGPGSVVMAGTVINADAVIGSHVIVNSGSIVEHDNFIGDYAHISPGSVMTGNVTVGTGAHVGAGAKVIPGKTIGDWAVVGAGAVVVHDIPHEQTAVGVPAVVKSKVLIK